MSYQDERPHFPRARGPWTDRLDFAEKNPFAFRPDEVVVMGKADAERAAATLRAKGQDPTEPRLISGTGFLVSLPKGSKVEEVVGRLRKTGVQAEPNYVFFAHAACGCTSPCALCGSGTIGHPFAANPFAANPFAANPFAANPFAANPFASNAVTANPFAANPFAANPFAANAVTANPFAANGFASTGIRRTSAKPAAAPDPKTSPVEFQSTDTANAIVYDTGIATSAHLSAELAARSQHKNAPVADTDEPDEGGKDGGDDKDGILDPVAGHGSFIAGLIELLAPKQNVRVHAVLSTFGDGSAATIAERITLDVDAMSDDQAARTVMNMSFGSYADQNMYLLAEAVQYAQQRGCVVVASAGNDGTCLPAFPATLPGVIGVASIDECGRAPYSNFGPWVRACAPGSDVVSSFYIDIDADQKPIPGQADDPDGFNGWAQWSGTSFAAPIVASAILRQMAGHAQTAQEAAAIVVDGPGLLRLPGLGTVVNLVPGM